MGFASVRSEAASHLPFTSRFFETSAPFELGKVPQPTAAGSSRAPLRKTAWQRAGSFLGLFFPFVSWSRRDVGRVTCALQMLWCCCPGRLAAPQTPLSPGLAWQRCQWPPGWLLETRPQSGPPASWPAAFGRGMEAGQVLAPSCLGIHPGHRRARYSAQRDFWSQST